MSSTPRPAPAASTTGTAPAGTTATTGTTGTAPSSETAMRIRKHSGIAAALFLPALVVAKVLLLTTETGSRCLVQGGCAPFPHDAFEALLVAVAVSVAVTMAAPDRVRRAALAVQLLLEVVAVGVVLSYP
ncbi:hypothetical protein ABZX75_12165 [Streptomyces sp. NPDC003038]|uniref:hypothetical protein n=1 Tax=unclassified Streptomyces TaxID=2593676 RepID=UPI0033A48B83